MASSANDIYVKLQKLSNANTKTTLNFNKTEANTARKWQETMSNTSHQREVKDLIAAGLNPVLSSGGSGAQSYTTSAANGSADNSAVGATANVYSADLSSSRSLQAAQSSAAAVRYSAMMNLKAAQEAASAQRYAADRAFEGTKYNTDNSKSGSPWAIGENLIRRGLALAGIDVEGNINGQSTSSYAAKTSNQIRSEAGSNVTFGSKFTTWAFYNRLSNRIKTNIYTLARNIYGVANKQNISALTGYLYNPKDVKYQALVKYYMRYSNKYFNF